MTYDWLDRWKDVGRKVNHSSFDLSKRVAITQPCSLLTPTLCFETVPNEQHKIKLDGILRSDTLNTAAFVNGTIHTNVFFVPYKQLWHPFNDLVSQKHDPHSSIFKDSKYAPNVLLSQILQLIHDEDKKLTGALKSMFGIPWHLNALRLLHYLKYGNFYCILGMDDSDFNDFVNVLNGYTDEEGDTHPRYVNMWRFLAYQHIFYDYYRNKYFDQVPWMGHLSPASQSSEGSFTYVGTFNVDDIACSDVASSHYDINGHGSYATDPNTVRLRQMLDMHYAQYKKDIYTSALPSTQFGAVSSLTLQDINIDASPDSGWDADSLSAYVDPNPETLKSGLAFSQSNSGGQRELAYKWSILNAFDVLQFRKAELLQQWKQNALRAGNQVDENFESHFGVKPYYEDDNVVRHLGSFSCHWDINPITATAATGDSVNGNVGDLAAIGVGQTVGDEITFECKDFGVVMAISSFVPDVYYDANGLDKANTLIEPFDYFYPEFQNIGFEPLSLLQQDVVGSSLVSAQGSLGSDVNLGFVPPYSWYKTNVDEVFGDFASDIYSGSNPAIGGMSGWVLKRHDSPVYVDGGNVGLRSLEQFYINPKTDDILFQDLNYNGKPATDHFAQALTWSIHSIRPMSMLGLPIFG